MDAVREILRDTYNSIGLAQETRKISTKQSNITLKGTRKRTSLVVQWLRLCAPNAGGQGSILGHGTRSHMPQLRSCAVK